MDIPRYSSNILHNYNILIYSYLLKCLEIGNIKEEGGCLRKMIHISIRGF